MDFSLIRFPLILLLSFLSIHAALGDFVCEELPNNVCPFSASSSGRRCLLEPAPSAKDGSVKNRCRTSGVVVEKLAGYIESDTCVKACGVDREAVGINADAFLEPRFLQNMCTPECYEKCPNLVELYFNFAAGEGVFLPYLCERQRSEPHRDMRETEPNAFKHPPFKTVIKEEEEDFATSSSPAGSEEPADEVVEIVVEEPMPPGPGLEQLVEDLMSPAPIIKNVNEDDDDEEAFAPSPAAKKAEEGDDDMAPSPVANALDELVDIVDMSPGPGSENIEEQEEEVAAVPGAKKVEAPRKMLEAFAFSLA